MKKTLVLSAVAIAGVAFAGDVSTSNSYGVLPITSSSKATMVAVPFVGDGANISIDQMVKAANLTAGDMIYALPTGSGSAYKVWELNSTCTAWEPVTNVEVGDGSTVFTPTEAAATTIARGQAFWLVRKNNPSSSFTFYVMGVGDTSAAAATAITGSAAGTWNLVGQSSATGSKTLADIVGVVGTKGYVRLNNGNRYLYTGSAWKLIRKATPNTPEDVASDTALPVGEGFWIVSKSSGSVLL